MRLTLEIAESEVCSMEVDSNSEVYAAANAWRLLLARSGITNYEIFKTFKSDADNQFEESGDDSLPGQGIEPRSDSQVAEVAQDAQVKRA